MIFLRSNSVDPDPRVEKEARALHAAGWDVTVLAWDRTGSLEDEEVAFGRIVRHRLPAPFGSGLRNVPRLVRWNAWLLRELWRRGGGPVVVHACDFDTVLPALAARRVRRGMRVVFDVFDFYAAGHWTSGTMRRIAAAIRGAERWAVERSDAVILPDDSRRELLPGRSAREAVAIYNTPERIDATARRADAPALTVTFVGVLYAERCIFEVLDVIAAHPEWTMHVAGFGGDEARVEARAAALPNVHWHGRVPYSRALELTCDSDVLFAIYDPRVVNHRHSSANKLFEAMMLGKPIIVARGTGMDAIVDRHALGYVIEYGDRAAIEAAFADVAGWSEARRAEFAAHALSVYETHYSWSIMRDRLVRLYRGLAA